MGKTTARSNRRRSAREGSVYQNGDRWRGAVTWTEADGTRRRRTVSARTSAEAREKLDRLRADLRLGTLAPSGSSVTVGEYLEGWIERHRARVRPSTWQTAEGYVRVYLIPALGRRPLARLSATDVEDALASFVREGRPRRAGDDRPRSPISPLSARSLGSSGSTARRGPRRRRRAVTRSAARSPSCSGRPRRGRAALAGWRTSAAGPSPRAMPRCGDRSPTG
jgi:hypothetical protein